MADPDYRPLVCVPPRQNRTPKNFCGVHGPILLSESLKPSICGPARRCDVAFNVCEFGLDGGFAKPIASTSQVRTGTNAARAYAS
jgi:hypothetical protein